MVGAVLTQNTAWTNVERAILNLRLANALDARAILSLSDPQLAALLKPSGYFNLKAARLKNLCQWYVEHGSETRLRYWPSLRLRRSLLAVKGIGSETADDILLYAFGRPIFVVDAYTRRIFSRLGHIEAAYDYEHVQRYFHQHLPPKSRLFNEYHALIVQHGKSVCRPRPRCDLCCLQNDCRYLSDAI